MKVWMAINFVFALAALMVAASVPDLSPRLGVVEDRVTAVENFTTKQRFSYGKHVGWTVTTDWHYAAVGDVRFYHQRTGDLLRWKAEADDMFNSNAVARKTAQIHGAEKWKAHTGAAGLLLRGGVYVSEGFVIVDRWDRQ